MHIFTLRYKIVWDSLCMKVLEGLALMDMRYVKEREINRVFYYIRIIRSNRSIEAWDSWWGYCNFVLPWTTI